MLNFHYKGCIPKYKDYGARGVTELVLDRDVKAASLNVLDRVIFFPAMYTV